MYEAGHIKVSPHYPYYRPIYQLDWADLKVQRFPSPKRKAYLPGHYIVYNIRPKKQSILLEFDAPIGLKTESVIYGTNIGSNGSKVRKHLTPTEVCGMNTQPLTPIEEGTGNNLCATFAWNDTSGFEMHQGKGEVTLTSSPYPVSPGRTASGSYRQHWRAYNEAQVTETERFPLVLRTLLAFVEDEEQQGPGRRRIPLRESLFTAILKVHTQLSSRRAQGHTKRAAEKGQIKSNYHFNTASRLLCRSDITPLLYDLIARSSAPLAGLEDEFAVDSSGFRTTCYGAYCQEKHRTEKMNIWLKLHICTGVRTNIITRASITDANGADSPQFKPLINGTAEDFTIREVSADKAYSSRENHDVVGEVGGEAYIPFKKNATGKMRGSWRWMQAYHFFQLERHRFNRQYHKRSNVETTFGAIKAKFGETLKSKDRVAQENELLCKIIAYNISVLLGVMTDMGISLKDLHLNEDSCT